MNTEWIDGPNGINAVTAVKIDPESQSFQLDTLNLAQKVYNMLNRIAISGGTYRDWLETVYTTGQYIERPETEKQPGLSYQQQHPSRETALSPTGQNSGNPVS